MIKLSIVVPVYNVRMYLDRCIKSIIASCGTQYTKVVEVILVDDGSTDGSGDLCDEFQKEYKNLIQVIHKKNEGLASARNAGLEYLKGEYVFFIDSDDWIEENTIPSLIFQIDKYGSDVVKFGYKRRSKGRCISNEIPGIDSGYYKKNDVQEFLYYEALASGKLFDYSTNFILSACVSLFKVDTIKKNKIVFESERIFLNEDYLFYLKLLHYANSVVVMSDCFYNYDCRNGSLTQRYKKNMYIRKCALLENYYEFAEKNGISQKKCFRARYSQFVIEHFYDCVITECLWNANSEQRYKNISIILKDKRLVDAMKNLNEIKISIKAMIICIVMKIRSPRLFYYLYMCIKKIG